MTYHSPGAKDLWPEAPGSTEALANAIADLEMGSEELDLWGSGLSPMDLILLLGQLNKRNSLQVLDVGRNRLGPETIHAVANFMRTNQSLKVLRMSGSRVSDVGADIVGKAISLNQGLECLELECNDITDIGLQSLCYGIEKGGPSLQSLSLANNRITSCGIDTLVCCLMHSRGGLQSLDLRRNYICDSGVAALAVFLQEARCQITHLDLSENLVEDLGATALGKALASPTCKLKSLKLHGNQIDVEGAKALAENIGNNSRISELTITDDGHPIDVQHYLGSSDIALGHEHVIDAVFISETLKHNSNLHSLQRVKVDEAAILADAHGAVIAKTQNQSFQPVVEVCDNFGLDEEQPETPSESVPREFEPPTTIGLGLVFPSSLNGFHHQLAKQTEELGAEDLADDYSWDQKSLTSFSEVSTTFEIQDNSSNVCMAAQQARRMNSDGKPDQNFADTPGSRSEAPAENWNPDSADCSGTLQESKLGAVSTMSADGPTGFPGRTPGEGGMQNPPLMHSERFNIHATAERSTDDEGSTESESIDLKSCRESERSPTSSLHDTSTEFDTSGHDRIMRLVEEFKKEVGHDVTSAKLSSETKSVHSSDDPLSPLKISITPPTASTPSRISKGLKNEDWVTPEHRIPPSSLEKPESNHKNTIETPGELEDSSDTELAVQIGGGFGHALTSSMESDHRGRTVVTESRSATALENLPDPDSPKAAIQLHVVTSKPESPPHFDVPRGGVLEEALLQPSSASKAVGPAHDQFQRMSPSLSSRKSDSATHTPLPTASLASPDPDALPPPSMVFTSEATSTRWWDAWKPETEKVSTPKYPVKLSDRDAMQPTTTANTPGGVVEEPLMYPSARMKS